MRKAIQIGCSAHQNHELVLVGHDLVVSFSLLQSGERLDDYYLVAMYLIANLVKLIFDLQLELDDISARR
jgi:hypothetical protein